MNERQKMKSYLKLTTLPALIFLIIALGFIGCSKKEVNGEVFVVTQGAGNIKLGLVTVYFLTEEQYKIASDTNKKDYLIFISLLNEMDSIKNYNYCMEHYATWQDLLRSRKKIRSSQYGDLREYYTDKDRKESDSSIIDFQNTINDFLNRATSFTRFRTDKRATQFAINKYLDSAKSQVISDKSNSDGKFKVELKNNKYLVYANSTRKIADSEEEYHWLFEYTPNDKPLYLSNDNLIK